MTSMNQIVSEVGGRPSMTDDKTWQKDGSSSSDFPALIEKGLERLNSQMSQADRLAASLAAGKELDIPQVMIAISKADISFRMFVQMRNKALSAYEEIMRLQF